MQRKGFATEFESRIGDKQLAVLGCSQSCFILMLEYGRMATVMSNDVEEFLESCVSKYCELAKAKYPLRKYSTPVLPDDHLRSVVGAPGVFPVTVCPRYHQTASPTSFVTFPSVAELMQKPKAPPVATGEEPQKGELHEVASPVLMKALWAAASAVLTCCVP